MLLIALTYAVWGLATAEAQALGAWIALPLTALAASFHASLTHEVVHGHPTRNQALNDFLVSPAISLVFPHDRYRALHLAHHHDPSLTDPHDDPESNYLDPDVWGRLPRAVQWLLRINNTLAGRMIVGPAISVAAFWIEDAKAIRRGDRAIRRAWARHFANLIPVAGWLALFGEISPLHLLAATYAGLSLQKVRSYLEHRAHEQVRGRTVIVERGGLLGFLFLNNNLHAVHHAHPRVAWYRLPRLYSERRDRFRARNFHYVYRGYGEIFRSFLLQAKDPVPHPLRPGGTVEEHRLRPAAPAPYPAPAAGQEVALSAVDRDPFPPRP